MGPGRVTVGGLIAVLLKNKAFNVLLWFLFIFLIAPIAVVVVAAFNSGNMLTVRIEGVSLQWFAAILDDPRWVSAALTSVQVAVCAAIGSVLLAFTAALSITWWPKWRGAGSFAILMTLPLLFPFTATGVALILLFRDWAILGTFIAFALAHILVTIPYAFRAILVSLETFNWTYVEASRMSGAGPGTTFRAVVIPLIGPGLVTGALFSALISLEEATVSLLLVGPGISTLPVEIYSQATQSASPVVAAVATLQMIAVLVTVWLAKRMFGLDVFTRAGGGAA